MCPLRRSAKLGRASVSVVLSPHDSPKSTSVKIAKSCRQTLFGPIERLHDMKCGWDTIGRPTKLNGHLPATRTIGDAQLQSPAVLTLGTSFLADALGWILAPFRGAILTWHGYRSRVIRIQLTSPVDPGVKAPSVSGTTPVRVCQDDTSSGLDWSLTKATMSSASCLSRQATRRTTFRSFSSSM